MTRHRKIRAGEEYTADDKGIELEEVTPAEEPDEAEQVLSEEETEGDYGTE